jgi:murein DD-endopeptidase MepM/ murein hydrolase activator NlpD
MVLTAAGLLGSITARAQCAPYQGDAQPALGGGERAMPPTALVWRSGEDSAQLIDVAHRRRHLRPEVDADPQPPHRHGRGHKQDAPTQTVTIKQGDTINSIARKFGTTPEAIMKANPDHRPNRLKLGTELKVPKAGAAAEEDQSDTTEDTKPAPHARHGRERAHGHERGRDEQSSETTTPKDYKVRRGDTLYSIAKRNGVTVDELKNANHLGSSTRLHSGQTLRMPGELTEAAPEAAPPAPPPSRPVRAARARARETEEWTLPPPRTQPPTRPAPLSPPAPGSIDREAARTQIAPPVVQAPPSSGGPAHPVPYASLPGAQSAPNPPAYTPPAYAPPPYAPPVQSAPMVEAPAGPSDAQVAAAGRGRFIWPANGDILSRFGPLPGGQRNDGVDISAADGTPVRAAASGDVVYAGNLVPGFGNLVLLKHEDGWVTAYAHLSKTEVKIKDHVSQGAEIGTVGSSGGVPQSELHFEVRYAPSPRERARPIDPSLVLSGQ